MSTFNPTFPVLHGLTISQGGYVQNLAVEQLSVDPQTSGQARLWYSTTESKFKISVPTANGTGTPDTIHPLAMGTDIDTILTQFTQQIDGEATARQNADNTLTALLQSEQQRAELAEQSIITSTSQNVTVTVQEEATRATTAETGLQTQINNLQSEINNISGNSSASVLRTSNTLAFTNNNANQVVDTYLISQYRSAIYNVQMTSSGLFEFTQVNLMHDGVNVYITEFGTLSSGGPLAELSANIVNGTMELMISPSNQNTSLVFERILFSV